MASEVKVSVLPDCDFHAQAGMKVTARYDAKTVYGPWANMCEECFKSWGPDRLGTGYGQRLVLAK